MKRKSDTFFDDHNFFEKVASDGRQLETRKSFQRVFHFFLFWMNELDAILLLSLEKKPKIRLTKRTISMKENKSVFG